MLYANQSLWLGSVAALCPSKDTAGNGTTTLTDFTGVSHGTLTGMDAATDWVDDDGYCLDFDGSNDYVITGQTPSASAKCASLSYWFKRYATGTTGPGIAVSSGIADGSNRISVNVFSDGNVYCVLGGANFGSFASNDTNWHNLILNYNGNGATNADRLKLYFDGVAKSLSFTGTIPVALPTIATSRLILGAIYTSSTIYGRGRVDDAIFTLKNFSIDEIATLASARGAAYAESAGGGSVRIPNIRGGADQ